MLFTTNVATSNSSLTLLLKGPAPSSNHSSLNTEEKESTSDKSPAGACALETAQPTIATVPVLNDSSAKVSDSQDGDSGNGDGKKKKNRCFVCKKKVGLTGFTCRCGGLFCSIHRYTDKHECTFDYKVIHICTEGFIKMQFVIQNPVSSSPPRMEKLFI